MKHSIIFGLLTVGHGTLACDICSVYNAPLAHRIADRGWHLSLSEQFTHFGTVQEDGRRVRNEVNQRMDSSISQVVAGYQFDDRFGLQFNLPLIHRSFRRAEGFGIDRGTEAGPGDVSLLASYMIHRKETPDWSFAWNIQAGVKFPTGNSDRLKEELNEVEVPGAPESGVHGHDLTLGSGSYDGIFGSEIYTRWRRLFFTAAAQYSLRAEGDFDYQFADDLTWQGGPGVYVVFTEEWTVGIQLNVSGEHKAKDAISGETADDTAITAVYLGPQIRASWRGQLGLELGAALPVSIDNSAFQIVPDYRIQGALFWQF